MATFEFDQSTLLRPEDKAALETVLEAINDVCEDDAHTTVFLKPTVAAAIKQLEPLARRAL